MTGKHRSNGSWERLSRYLNSTASDPTYLVLKAHLLAEEVLYCFIEKQAIQPECLKGARLTFAQLLALCCAFHPYRRSDWWCWTALKKLNALRNLLAHNLEPKDLNEDIAQFSLFVAEGGGVVSDSKLSKQDRKLAVEYEKLIGLGVHPFVLAIVGLHMSLSTALGFESDRSWTALR